MNQCKALEKEHLADGFKYVKDDPDGDGDGDDENGDDEDSDEDGDIEVIHVCQHDDGLNHWSWKYSNEDEGGNTLVCTGSVCSESIRVIIDRDGKVFKESSLEIV
uniref:Uncharacterized protein n=1 Tax=Proboscia inermis TaxID=420281 RepID=A0A7S0CJM3_9STRA